jgi:type VI secretion system protein ImpH
MKQEPGVRQAVFDEYYRFSFFQAVNLIERMFPGKNQLDRSLSPKEESIRFSVKPGFAFPPSDISALKKGDDGGPVEMQVAFMGMIGPAGVLPYWYNELTQERIKEKDYSMIAFLDMFHHRIISLFYLAWKRYRIAATTLPAELERYSVYIASLMGLGTPGLSGKVGLPGETPLYYGGLMSRHVPSAVAIASAVEYYFGAATHVEQFIPRLISMEPEDCTVIGSMNSLLGVNATCGNQAWECQTKFRIELGPMNYKQFSRLLPMGSTLGSLFSLVKYMVGIEYEFDVRLVLKREEVKPCQLGGSPQSQPRLGWTTWIMTPGISHDHDPFVTFQETDCIVTCG